MEFNLMGIEVSSDLTLLDYIRNYAELRGTKYMCREGGCGACIVSASKSPNDVIQSVNSCLVSITSCQDWDITTIEKVGNKLDGYDPIQTTLAEQNGTQCGYCTPGWVMAMHSLLQNQKQISKLEIEKSFAGNICRCTGYRPILDAFKKFGTDTQEIADIEDLNVCKKTGKLCVSKTEHCDKYDWCLVSEDNVKQNVTQINLKDGRKWFRPTFIVEIFSILNKEGYDSYMLVAGNTAKGAYPILEYPRILIDISSVSELKGYFMDQNLVIGGGVTLTNLLSILKIMANIDYFGYLQKFVDHLNLVANIPVRNLGTIAGNLMIKHQHNEFQSDVFLLLETVAAQLTILNPDGTRDIVTMGQFLKIDMRGKIICHILLPPLTHNCNVITFKIMPRAQNAHAIVNAGFLYKIQPSSNTVLQTRIVYGGLSPAFIRATVTESYLFGKYLFANETLQGAIKVLKKELIVQESPPEPSAVYRKQLAINLFYKGLLSLCPSGKLNPRYRSGMTRIKEYRPLSDGRQIFDTNPTLWPLNQPIPKLEALIQCSGEAPYSEDIPTMPREVFAAFVLSEISKGTIASIDFSRALSCPGVIACYTAKDISGINSFMPGGSPLYPALEEVLIVKEVKHYHQPVAIVVAETRAIADRVVNFVDIKYENVKTPVIDVKDAAKDPDRNTVAFTSYATDKGTNVQKVIKGEDTTYGQYHFCMETLVCVAKPIEEGLEVYASTQWMDGVQWMVARALNLDINRVDVHVRRIGGGYGIKLSRPGQVAVACGLVAKNLNRPCRFIPPMTTSMKAIGKRFPCFRKFEVGVDNEGVIQYINYDLHSDNGYIVNEPIANMGFKAYNNCYNNKRWNYNCFNTTTDNAKNCSCRSPATLETIAMAEILMERISYELAKDPLEVRLNNLDNAKYEEIRPMIDSLKSTANYIERKTAVDQFNKENRWKKRGIRFSLCRWTPEGTRYFDINVSIYHGDGTVVITHSGIEMGQGVNTKAAQIAAYIFKISIEKIQIKANNTIIAPNGYKSGGSLTSQNVGLGVQRACKQLLSKLEPVRKSMQDPTWKALIKRAFEMGIDLQGHGFVNKADPQNYNIYGVVLAEVEVDILTGEHEILRVDILQDVGRSVSPEIDIGQIEGAFVMGIGYWTCEELVYDKNTGKLLTDRTWNYHVPQARDIPQDFRIYFRKNSYSNDKWLGAKGTGEPPICLSVVVAFALREAIAQARLESGIPTTKWFDVDGPFTFEKNCLSCVTSTENLKYY